MLKKIGFLSVSLFTFLVSPTFAEEAPAINCEGLPGCSGDGADVIEIVASNIISEIIKYVAVVAVLALMISGVMYMLSSGDEEKTKKARTWIIYSVVAVLLSISSWFIVNTLNEINLNI